MSKRSVGFKKNYGVLFFVMCLAIGLIFQGQTVYSQTDGTKVSDAKVLKTDENTNSPVGIWQYPGRAVWIYINDADNAFQCRIGKDETVYRSQGNLVEAKQIVWDKIWGTDQISIKDGKISLKGKYGNFSYTRVNQISDTRCALPSQMSEPYQLPMPSTLSDGYGRGGGIGDGRGVGQGSGFGTGSGSGMGSGSGDGTGSGVGRGTGSGSGIGSGRGTGQEKVKPLESTRSVRILSKPTPSYTKVARANNVQGTVTLRVTFLSNGKIGSVFPIKGLPHGLTERAIAAARQINFEPEIRNGKPITVNKTLVYTFTIY